LTEDVATNRLASINIRYLVAVTETSQLIATIKRQLKAQGLTYREVAAALHLSEPSIKRLFASKRLTVDRLAQLSHLLGFTLAELAQEVLVAAPRLRTLSADQEARVVSDIKLLLVAVCALNNWSLAEIVSAYRVTEAECIKRLVELDRMGLIKLLPGNRIRLIVERDFDWLPDGPISRFFRNEGQGDFLNSVFAESGETSAFVYGMLTQSALAQLLTELRRLRKRFAELHEEGLSAPLNQKKGTGLLLAMRVWEPRGFTALRRARSA